MFSTKLDGEKDFVELRPVTPIGGEPGRQELASRLNGLTPQNGTGLYDSSLAAYDAAAAALLTDRVLAFLDSVETPG